MAKKADKTIGGPNLPELFSKNAIGIFSVLFSTFFGAMLLMSNLKNSKQRGVILAFGVGYTIATLGLLFIVRGNSNVAILLNLGGAYLLTSFFWNKFIGKDYAYKPKKYKKIMLLLILLIVCILFLIYGHLILLFVVSFFDSLVNYKM